MHVKKLIVLYCEINCQTNSIIKLYLYFIAMCKRKDMPVRSLATFIWLWENIVKISIMQVID